MEDRGGAISHEAFLVRAERTGQRSLDLRRAGNLQFQGLRVLVLRAVARLVRPPPQATHGTPRQRRAALAPPRADSAERISIHVRAYTL